MRRHAAAYSAARPRRRAALHVLRCNWCELTLIYCRALFYIQLHQAIYTMYLQKRSVDFLTIILANLGKVICNGFSTKLMKSSF